MYALVENKKIKKYPYSIGLLQQDNPNTSFPSEMNDSILAEFGVYVVEESARPEHNESTEKIVEDDPKLVSEQWKQSWLIVPLSEEEKVLVNQRKKASRLVAFQQEADPLYFKWKAGEGTEEEWLAKREEIRNNYPYI